MADIRDFNFRRDDELLLEDDNAKRRKLAAEYLRDDTRELPMRLRHAIADFLEGLDAPTGPGRPKGPPKDWYEIGLYLDDEKNSKNSAAERFGLDIKTVGKAYTYYLEARQAQREADQAEREAET